MLNNIIRGWFLLVGVVLAGNLWALPLCTENTPKSNGTEATCEIVIDDIYLTQTSVGKVAVSCKRLKIDKQVEGMLNGAVPNTYNVTAALNQYLSASSERIMPLVVGPNGKFYTTDHHHLGTAIWTYKSERKDYDRSKLRFQAYIATNWSNSPDITMDNFWAKMADTNRAWPYDNNGNKLTGHFTSDDGPYPQDFGETRNDKYRSLSRWVRESCLYIKEGKTQCKDIAGDLGITPTKGDFEEFVWANYLRTALPWPDGKKDSVTKLLKLWKSAPKKASSKEAKEYLEGFAGGPTAFGYNKKGKYLKLDFDGGCEEPTNKVKKP